MINIPPSHRGTSQNRPKCAFPTTSRENVSGAMPWPCTGRKHRVSTWCQTASTVELSRDDSRLKTLQKVLFKIPPLDAILFKIPPHKSRSPKHVISRPHNSSQRRIVPNASTPHSRNLNINISSHHGPSPRRDPVRNRLLSPPERCMCPSPRRSVISSLGNTTGFLSLHRA